MRSLRRGSVATAPAVLLLALGLAGCGSASAPVSDDGVAPPETVILISIDTLRADHLGLYGYEPNTSPRLDAFAREAVVFEHALSTAPWTLPSHMSMLTSLNPALHQVTADGRRLGSEGVLVSEPFQDAGWETAAVVAAPYLGRDFGFAQGFDVYDDETISYDRFRQAHRVRTSLMTHLRALELIDAAEGPLFLFLHYWDVHFDYTPPFPFDEMFDPDYEGTLTGQNFFGNRAINQNMDPRDLRHLVALYDGEIAFVDFMLGRLFDELRRRGRWDGALVVVTADHGEEFFEHENKGHRKNLYDTSLHVPLLVKLPGGAFAGTRVADSVGIVDIAFTLLDVAGLPPLPVSNGRSLIERLVPGSERVPTYFADLESRHKAAVETPFKLIRPAEGEVELYDRRADPAELDNLAAERPDVRARLERRLDEWIALSDAARAGADVEERSYDPRLLESLRALGYVR